jgi:hypothetical protein
MEKIVQQVFAARGLREQGDGFVAEGGRFEIREQLAEEVIHAPALRGIERVKPLRACSGERGLG